MKKFLDRYLFSRLGLQLLFSILAMLLFCLVGSAIRSWVTGHSAPDPYAQALWCFRQVTDSGSMAGTLDGLDAVAAESRNGFAAPVVLAVTFLAWLVGMVLYGFVAGAVANAFAGRKEKIDAGLVRYRFRDHGIVFGWDGQGPACVKELLKTCRDKDVLVVCGAPASDIRDELARTLSPDDLRRVYVCNGRVAADESLLADSRPELARRIVVLGERDGKDGDGAALHVARMVRRRIEAEASAREPGDPPVEVFLHVEDPAFYLQSLSVESDVLAGGVGPVDLDVFNRFESWAWRCWSKKDARDGGPDGSGDAYLPLRHRPDAKRVELFVVGAGPVGPTMARYALPLMNDGTEGRHNRVTLFGCAAEDRALLPERTALDALPECEVVFRDEDGLSDEANAAMFAAASDPDAAVTIVVAAPDADAAVRAYAGLANELRRLDVSILLWQPTESDKLPPKAFLQTAGDRAKLRFFGMADVLPWMDAERQKAGSAAHFFYSVACDEIKGVALPATDDPGFAASARAIWEKNEDLARELWRPVARWERWSSVNAADSFREKAASFPDFERDASVRARLLRAEHDRWWTERLLAGWKKDKKKNKDAFLHPNLVPFDELDHFTKELDRAPIAAMVALGFGKE